MKQLDPFWETNPANPKNFYEDDVNESWLDEAACNEDDEDEKDEESKSESDEEMNEEEIKKIIMASAPPKVHVEPVIKEEVKDPYANILKDVQ